MKKFIKIMLIASIAALFLLLIASLVWMIATDFPEKAPNWISIWFCADMIALIVFAIGHLFTSGNFIYEIKKFIKE